ncbi:hypothetical protein [Streptomyces albospinus]|uniref:hypothetical protein n=1 Tax=Streptomyces albospinus TaxID=285515 RepID=UPI0016708AA2|nr:hypothetical protein [Streptomyces albospinus]
MAERSQAIRGADAARRESGPGTGRRTRPPSREKLHTGRIMALATPPRHQPAPPVTSPLITDAGAGAGPAASCSCAAPSTMMIAAGAAVGHPIER